MTESLNTIPTDLEIINAAKLVTTLFRDEFDPLTNDELKNLVYSEKTGDRVLSGSVRCLSVEDLSRRTYVDMVEVYARELHDRECVESHLLLLYLTHKHNNYGFMLDFDTFDLYVGRQQAQPLTQNMYPTIRKRVLGTLVLAANDLF